MKALLRLLLLVTATVFALASGSSNSNTPPANYSPTASGTPLPQPPASRPMDPLVTHGVWKSNFGPVKMEADSSRGDSGLMGVWLYERDGQEVIGFFSGEADGNVLKFGWHEGSTLGGAGYLVFDPAGGSFTGRWWTTNRDRGGDWNGWRAREVAPASMSSAPVSEPAPTPEPDYYQ